MSPSSNHSSSSDILALTQEISLLRLEQGKLELERQKRELNETKKKGPTKPWWASAIEFLALPAAVIAIAVQFTNASSTVQTTAKTEAETAKINVEVARARVELQRMLNDVAEKEKTGSGVSKEEVVRAIPQLEKTIEHLDSVQAQSKSTILERSFAKYIMIWVLFHFVGLVFDILSQIWVAMINAASAFLTEFRMKTKSDRENFELQRRLVSVSRWIHILLAPVLNVLRWSVQLSIFIALVIPLFNEISYAIGARTSFDVVMMQAGEFEISAALSTMKQVLFGAPL